REKRINSGDDWRGLSYELESSWIKGLCQKVARPHIQQMPGFGCKNRCGIYSSRVGLQEINRRASLAVFRRLRPVVSQSRVEHGIKDMLSIRKNLRPGIQLLDPLRGAASQRNRVVRKTGGDQHVGTHDGADQHDGRCIAKRLVGVALEITTLYATA